MTKPGQTSAKATGTDPTNLIMLSGGWTREVVLAFERLGIDAFDVCKKAGLSRNQLVDPQARFPRDVSGKLWRTAAEVTRDRFLGLHVGEAMAPRGDELVALLVINSNTLAQGIRTAVRYQELLADGEVVTLDESGDPVEFRIHKVEGQLPVMPEEIECVATAIVKFLRVATLDTFRLDRIRFAHPYRGSVDEYERVFDCPVEFGKPPTTLFIPSTIWNAELPSGDAVLQAHLETAAADTYQRIRTTSFISIVSNSIRDQLPTDRCDVESVARALSLGGRTLQRRLREEGTNFRDLLDSTRHRVVIEGLEHHRSHSEIARRAGLANARALTRALRRWNST